MCFFNFQFNFDRALASEVVIEERYFSRLPYQREFPFATPIAGQAQSKSVKERAYADFCLLLDFCLCQPSAILLLLEQAGVDVDKDYPVLKKYVKHYRRWRLFVVAICMLDPDGAKTELNKIFFGGRPKYECPPLMALALEVC